MPEILEFEKTYQYDTLKTGINLPVILHSTHSSVEIQAKLDTGASFCIFEREHGELLGLAIKAGERTTIGTATGNFIAYGHRLQIETFGLVWESTVYFVADTGIKANVLGRIGWLDRVVLGLKDYDGQLFVNSYSG